MNYDFEITNNCNYQCVDCRRYKINKPNSNVTTDEFNIVYKNLIEILSVLPKKLGITIISGGEPSLYTYEQLTQIISKLSEYSEKIIFETNLFNTSEYYGNLNDMVWFKPAYNPGFTSPKEFIMKCNSLKNIQKINVNYYNESEKMFFNSYLNLLTKDCKVGYVLFDSNCSSAKLHFIQQDSELQDIQKVIFRTYLDINDNGFVSLCNKLLRKRVSFTDFKSNILGITEK